MGYYKKTLHVTYQELTCGVDPVITRGALDKQLQRGTIERSHRGGGEGSHAQIIYSSLPDKYQKRFVAKYGDPEQKMIREMILSKVKKTRMRSGSSRSTAMTRTARKFPFPNGSRLSMYGTLPCLTR